MLLFTSKREGKFLNNDHLCIIEAALFASSEPLTVERLLLLFPENDEVSSEHIQSHIEKLQQDCQQRGVDLVKVASGYRFQAKQEYAAWLQRLWERKPPRCSRALLETLALIVYRQPITRGEIECVQSLPHRFQETAATTAQPLVALMMQIMRPR